MDAVEFLQKNGRLPSVAAEGTPWRYRGWLIPYLLMMEERGIGHGRWGWWTDILSGRSTPTKIPQIQFGNGDGSGKAHLQKLADDLFHVVGSGWNSLGYLMRSMLWGFGMDTDGFLMDDKAEEVVYRGLDLKKLLEDPADHFGSIIADGKGGGKSWNPTAFFPTPHNVCEMMVRMQMHDFPGDLWASVCDPCVGTGRMLLHASNYSLNLHGQDIDAFVLLACKINGFLYAPWLVRPAPAEMIARLRGKASSPSIQLLLPGFREEEECSNGKEHTEDGSLQAQVANQIGLY